MKHICLTSASTIADASGRQEASSPSFLPSVAGNHPQEEDLSPEGWSHALSPRGSELAVAGATCGPRMCRQPSTLLSAGVAAFGGQPILPPPPSWMPQGLSPLPERLLWATLTQGGPCIGMDLGWQRFPDFLYFKFFISRTSSPNETFYGTMMYTSEKNRDALGGGTG